MKTAVQRTFVLLACIVAASCNQPFEPDAPANNRLVVYGILNSASSTQYVRVGTTYNTPPAPELHNAIVEMLSNGRTIVFRDTTVTDTLDDGTTTPVNVYIGRTAVNGGSPYTLQVTTPAGLSVSATTNALVVPSFYLKYPATLNYSTNQGLVLSITFGSYTGAFVVRFFVEFSAYIDGAWQLRRLEVPIKRYTNLAGEEVKVFPSFALVQSVTLAQKSLTVEYDTLQYQKIRGEAIQTYAAAPVQWKRGVFVLTQIDNVLFNYYKLQNGPADKSSLRLDQLDYTNISNGLGIFGSYAVETKSYNIYR